MNYMDMVYAAIHRQATCPGSCTASALSEPIHVFASNLHMHYAGMKMYTHQYASNGTRLQRPLS